MSLFIQKNQNQAKKNQMATKGAVGLPWHVFFSSIQISVFFLILFFLEHYWIELLQKMVDHHY